MSEYKGFDAGNSEAIWDKIEEEKRDKIAEEKLLSIDEELEKQRQIKAFLNAFYQEEVIRRDFYEAQRKAFPELEEDQLNDELNDADYERKEGLGI